MATGDNQIQLEITLDDGSVKKAFATVQKEGDAAAGSLGDAFKVRGLADFTAGLFLISEAASKVGEAIHAAFDLTLEGEQIKATGIRFETLAQQAGLLPDALEKGISASLKGTVDLDDALKVASQSIVTLGSNASRLPELFDLARKSSLVFGTDTLTQFEKLSNAINTGSQKQLKFLGVGIDTEKVLAAYARTLGTVADQLGPAERQQAILNAVLEKGATAYKNIDGSITPLSQSTKELGVAFKGVSDNVALTFDKYFSGFFTSQIKSLSLTFKDLANQIGSTFLGKDIPIADQLSKLEAQLNRLKELQLLNPNTAQQFDEQISTVQSKINSLTQTQTEQTAVDQQAATAKIQLGVATDLAADAQKRNEEAIRSLNKAIQEAQIPILREAQDAYEQTQNSGFKFFSGFAEGAKNLAGNATTLGKAVSGQFVGGLTTAFTAFGSALVTGQNAFGEFGKSILKTIGGLAIQIGQFLLLIGLGFTGLGFLGFTSGAGAIAAGAGLIILGGVLQALAGGGGSTASGGDGGGGGGGLAATPNNTNGFGTPTDITPEQSLTREANTNVNVTIQGDVLDSDASGTRIVQILNDAFDKQGVVIRGAN